MTELMRGAIPLPEDPSDDPPDHDLLQAAIVGAAELAAAHGLHAASVTLVEKAETFTAEGDVQRFAMFTAEAIAI